MRLLSDSNSHSSSGSRETSEDHDEGLFRTATFFDGRTISATVGFRDFQPRRYRAANLDAVVCEEAHSRVADEQSFFAANVPISGDSRARRMTLATAFADTRAPSIQSLGPKRLDRLFCVPRKGEGITRQIAVALFLCAVEQGSNIGHFLLVVGIRLWAQKCYKTCFVFFFF